MTRLEVLAKIDELEDAHCTNCTLIDRSKSQNNQFCFSKCEVGEKIQSLGKELMKPHRERIESLLAKGQDLTYSDIQFLKSKEVTNEKIMKAMKISSVNYYKYIKRQRERISGLEVSE